MDPERLHKGTPAGDAWRESGSKHSPRSPRHPAPPKQFPPAVWRWRRSCWNSRWIFSAYPGSHGRIIPKAFQELDPGSVLSQLMLALQIGICPNRSEAGHELCFILAIVQCFFGCCLLARPRTAAVRLTLASGSRHQRARRCSQKTRARTLQSCIIANNAA